MQHVKGGYDRVADIKIVCDCYAPTTMCTFNVDTISIETGRVVRNAHDAYQQCP